MDLSTNQELTVMPSGCSTKNGTSGFLMEETHEETDIIGTNNMLNSLKTDTNINDHEPSSLFQGNCIKETELEVDNSLFSYSSFKKAMNLKSQNIAEEIKRTIFEDAEYFAENYCYKLLPITFEQVDETIIQTEHNYSLSSPNSESEAEDCSRTMDYSQIKEKNYKKRKTKVGIPDEEAGSETSGDEKSEMEVSSIFNPEKEFEPWNCSEDSAPVQPLDLSVPPLVQEEKTDPCLREPPDSIFENDDGAQPDSDKENVNLELNGIRVTITRPDEKENYQPCDLFLNDVARLVPWLIGKDCCEVDILDRTCDRHEELRTHRLYYVISESTWRLFQKSSERVILTNDQSLGQPLTKIDKNEKPSYLIFDQFSLAKCLAEYCEEIGGCFEYTCVEEEKGEQQLKEKFPEEEFENCPKTVEEVQKMSEAGESITRSESEKMEEETEEKKIVSENVKADEESQKEDQKVSEIVKTDLSEAEIKKKDEKNDEVTCEGDQGEVEERKATSTSTPKEKIPSNVKKKVSNKKKKKISRKAAGGKGEKPGQTTVAKKLKKQSGESSIQQQPNISQITTRSKSTSVSKASQKNDKSVIRRGGKKPEPSTLPEEPPNKRIKLAQPEDLRKITRSGRVLENKPIGEKKNKKEEKKKEAKKKNEKGEERMLRLRKRVVQRLKEEANRKVRLCLRPRSKKR